MVQAVDESFFAFPGGLGHSLEPPRITGEKTHQQISFPEFPRPEYNSL
jgi:hypothetical protein